MFGLVTFPLEHGQLVFNGGWFESYWIQFQKVEIETVLENKKSNSKLLEK